MARKPAAKYRRNGEEPGMAAYGMAKCNADAVAAKYRLHDAP